MSSSHDLDWTSELQTPALLLDVGVLDRNIGEMAALTRDAKVKHWPHLKSHKSDDVARRQLHAGATGITCQTLAEVEIALRAGAPRVLIGRPVVSGSALKRLVGLAGRVELSVVADSDVAVDRLSAAASGVGVEVGVMLEIDCAYRRCGLPPERARLLAERIEMAPGVVLAGVMAYEGQVYDLPDPAQAAVSASETYDTLGEVASDLRLAGHAVERVSAGASSVAAVAAGHQAINELRCGSYALRDRIQVELGAGGVDRCALRVLSTVISRPAPDRVVLDAGAKTLSFIEIPSAVGYGLILDAPGARLDRLADEHGLATVPPDSDLTVGDRVEVLPNAHPIVVAMAEAFELRDKQKLIGRWSIDRRR
jgi:D-serine deaminase-like pyridoxal phosphate-dependent protein